MGSFMIMWILMLVVCGGAFLMKDKLAGMFSDPEYTRKHNLAMEKINSDYVGVLTEYVNDEQTFKFLKDITGEENIKGILNCKKQRSIMSAMTGAAKAVASGVVKIEVGTKYWLVMGKETIYNVQSDTKTKKWVVLKTFKKSEIEKIDIKKWNMVDDLKQAQKFKLEGGWVSGDGADNSKLKKVIITLDNEKEEFFCYENIFSGTTLTQKKAMSRWSDLKTLSEKDVLENILIYTIPTKTFESLAQEYNGTLE